MAKEQAQELEELRSGDLDLIDVPDDFLEVLSPGENLSGDGDDDADESADAQDDEGEIQDEEAADEEDADAQAGEESDEEERLLKDEKKPTRKEKRIGQLIFERKQAEERAAAEAAAREVSEQRLRELEARLNDARKRSVETETGHLTERIEAAKARRTKASEEADLEAFATANDELIELRIQQDRVNRREIEENQTTSSNIPTRQEQPPDQMHPAAEGWLRKNTWYLDPAEKEKAERALAIQNNLLNRGYSFGEDLYQELDKQLEKEFPVGGEEDSDEQTKSKRKSDEERKKPRKMHSVGSASSDVASRRSKPKPGQLTEHDIQAIRMAQLDPNDPKVRETYLKYKRK
jgi:hypothetical protein